MRAWVWVVLALTVSGPAEGQEAWNFSQAIDFIRLAGPAIAYANKCLRDPMRIIRTKDAAVALASYGRTKDEVPLIEAAMSIEIVYHNALPKLETCPDWIEHFLSIERAVDPSISR